MYGSSSIENLSEAWKIVLWLRHTGLNRGRAAQWAAVEAEAAVVYWIHFQ
jgi:hypothetical protein